MFYMESKVEQALRFIVDQLNVATVPYQLTGGLAARLYGAQREVNDIDFDIYEEDFDKILPLVRDFVVYGPADYEDNRWKIKRMTLDYYGQKIDFSGARNQQIFDDRAQAWIDSSADFSTSVIFDIGGREVTVISPEDLADYKQYLSGEHQKKDIAAVKEYLQNK